MENFAQGPLATTIPGGADWGSELPFPKRNPFVQAGALSTDSISLNSRENAIDGGVDKLKESFAFIPLCQILKATNDFDDALVIGVVGSGKVYKANIDDGATTTVVAIKRWSAESEQGAEEFLREVKFLSKFRHTNLVSVIGYCNEKQEKILVYEYLAKGSLANHLYKTSREESGGSRSHLTWAQRIKICIGVARGLAYLHTVTSQPIIHGDLKSTNILLDDNFEAKVSDLGLFKNTTHTATHISTNVKGTFGLLDPDYFTKRLTTKIDVYAFGVVMLEILCAWPSIDTSLEEEKNSLVNWALKNIKKGKLDGIIDSSLNGDTTPDSLTNFVKLAKNCLHNQPKERPEMAEVVKSLEFALQLQERKRRSQGTIGKAWMLGTLHRNPLQLATLKRLGGSLTRRKKKHMREGLNGECLTKSAHLVKADERGPTVSNAPFLEDLRHQFGARCKDAAKGLHDSLAWKSFKVQDNLPLGEQSYTRQRSLTHKHCVRLKKSQDLPRSMLRDCTGGLASQSDIGLPDEGHILSLSEKKIVRKTLKRKCRTMSVLSLEDHQRHVGRRWEDTVKFLGAKRICRQLVIHREITAKHIRRQLGTRQWLFKQSAIGLPDGGHILYLLEKKIVRKTLKRKCRSISVLSLEDHKQHVDRMWEDAAKSHGMKCIHGQLVIHCLSTAKRTHKQHGIHQWPFQRSAIGLPDRGHILSLSEKKIVRKTLKRKYRSMSVLSLVDRQQRVDRRWEDAAKNIGAKCIYRQLVIHRVSIAKHICRQHGIHHRWPFERDWATKKGYSLGDERPVEVICLSTHAELVLRLQLIYISWLGRFSPWPSALPRGGLIVGPIALSSSEFAATNNLAQCVRQDQRGSGASGSENERTTEQEDPRQDQRGSGASGSGNEGTRKQKDPKEIRNTSITKDDLLPLHGRMTKREAAAYLCVSESTVKRIWKECKMGPWKNGGRRRVWKPPDEHGEGNTSTARETPSHNVQTGMEGEPVGQNQEANESQRDFMGRQIALNPESGLIMVSRPPDRHGERNTSTARETPSHNVQTGIEGVPVGQNQEANEFRPDFTEGSIPLTTENRLIIGSSFGRASQVNDQSILSTPYPNHDAFGFPQPQTTSMPSENMGGSIDLRNSLASHVVSDGHISGSTNSTFATCSVQVGPSQHVQGQSMHPTVYPDHNVFPQTQIVSLQEPLSEGHVFGFGNGNEHTNFVMIKAFYRYGDNTIFKFPFPLTSGIDDLKKEVSKRLNVEVDRFVVKYKDKYEDLISILCTEDLMLYLWSSLGNDEINVLVLDKVGGTPNFCEKCRSSMQTRA